MKISTSGKTDEVYFGSGIKVISRTKQKSYKEQRVRLGQELDWGAVFLTLSTQYFA